jgi:hypothetical protein
MASRGKRTAEAESVGPPAVTTGGSTPQAQVRGEDPILAFATTHPALAVTAAVVVLALI